MSKPKRYKRFSAELKREAIRRAATEDKTDKEVCEELGIGRRIPTTVHYWWICRTVCFFHGRPTGPIR
jgi:transposase-like protein